MKSEREQTIEVLEHIRDLLEPWFDVPGKSQKCVSKAWALAYAELERLSRLELEAVRTAFEEDDETVCLDAALPMFGGPNVSDSALLTMGGA